MASYAFRISGIAPADSVWHLAGDDVHRSFWKEVVRLVLIEKDRELAEGKDRNGIDMVEIRPSTRKKGRWRSHTGQGTAENPPLDPAQPLSRTRSLFRGRAHADHAEFFWAFDTVLGIHWGKMLGWHRKGNPKKNLPVRDVIGLSPASLARVQKGADRWWADWKRGHAMLSRVSLFEVQIPPPSGRPVPERPKVAPVKGARFDIEHYTFGIGATEDLVKQAIAEGKFSGFSKVVRPGRARPPEAPPKPPKAPKPKPPTTRPKPAAWVHPPRPIPGRAKGKAVKPPAKPKPEPAPTIGSKYSPTKDRQKAVDWAAVHGVALAPGTQGEVTIEQLNSLNTSLAKLPKALHQRIIDEGGTLQFFTGRGIADHPNLAELKGVTPRGYPAGKTWDDVPGAGGRTYHLNTYLVANSLDRAHGSVNMVQHEQAHTYDAATARSTGSYVSESAEWRDLHQLIDWRLAYLTDYPEESFAESLAKYYNGPESRATLDPRVQEFFRKRFA